MEENEMLEQTSETENVETETTEEIMDEGIELTDTTETDESEETEEVEEKEESKHTLRELLKNSPEYQEEFNSMVKARLSRQEREYQRELSKYKDTDAVLRSTLNIQEGEDVNQKLRETYEAEGIKLPSKYEPGLSNREIEALAEMDVKEIVEEGYEAMVNEANKLAEKKYQNLNERERFIFNKLAERLTDENNKRELLKLGAKEELLYDKKFIEFKKQFNSDASMETIYGLFKASQPKQKAENPGSMKNTSTGPKTFISEEEYDKMSREEIRSNMDLIEKSMENW